MCVGIAVEELSPRHHGDLVQAAWQLRILTGLYPPPQDCGSGLEDIGQWWTTRTDQAAWVAVDKGKTIGHVAVSAPGTYLDRFCTGAQCLEITGLFVHPDHARRGAGGVLLRTARAYCASAGARPLLTAVTTWRPAIDLYLRSGMHLAGGFRGRHGLNLVFTGPPLRFR